MANKDDHIADTLRKYKNCAKKIGFKPVANRADGMLEWRSWSMETNFVHGEGRVILTQNRTAGDRSNSRKVILYVHGKQTIATVTEKMREVVGS